MIILNVYSYAAKSEKIVFHLWRSADSCDTFDNFLDNGAEAVGRRTRGAAERRIKVAQYQV